jgi:deazaflavin-dependent oxidoreductase (nitroreductase family)
VAVSDFNNFNQQIIDQFRANDGKVEGFGDNIVLLHHVGAKSGTERINPLAAQLDGDNIVIFASKGGAPTNPDWFHNLKANPDTVVEFGKETKPVHARVAEGAEQDRLWTTQKELMPGFAEYEEKTDRIIPVVVLEPR